MEVSQKSDRRSGGAAVTAIAGSGTSALSHSMPLTLKVS